MSVELRRIARWLALYLVATGVAVADGAAGRVAPAFEPLDRNGDNRLSRSEASYNRLLAEIFAASDVDGDGFVSRAEYERATYAALQTPDQVTAP